MSKKRESIIKEVFVQRSPVSNIKQKGNLTGNIRVLRDHVADMGNLIYQWDKELMNGVGVISEIKNLMCEKIEKYSDNPIGFPNNDKLQTLCNYLNEICERMKQVVEKLGQKRQCIVSLQKLEENHEATKIGFLTWPISKFVQTSQDVFEMYQKEFEMKITVKEEICFCTDSSQIIFFSAAWLHQPYIEKSVTLGLEAMMKEVGHSSVHDKISLTGN